MYVYVQNDGGGEDVDGETGPEDTEDGEIEALNLEHMEGVFMMACIGWFVALHAFIVEAFVCKN